MGANLSFRCGVNGIRAFFLGGGGGFYATYNGSFLLTFRDIFLSLIELLKMAPIGCLENSVRNDHSFYFA